MGQFLRRAASDPRLTLATQVGALELVVVGVTALVATSRGRPLDSTAYVLLGLAAAVAGVGRWPVVSFGLCLGATLAYYGLGYPTDGPIYVGVLVVLYRAVVPDNPTRSIILGAVAIFSFFTVRGAGAGGGTFPAWVAASLVLGHAVGNRRAYRAVADDRARLAEQSREDHAQRLVAEERLRIARELHDVLSHSISIINVQAGVAAHLVDETPAQAREALVAIRTTSKQAIQELRGLLGVLRQPNDGDLLAPAPGLDQLEALIASVREAGLSTRLCKRGAVYPLPPAVDLAAYRIVQESLTNSLRYAGPAASAKVSVTYTDGQIVLEVTDTGLGLPGPSHGSGLGLAGMRERARAVGGNLEAGPRPEGGFRVCVRLPVDP